MSNNVGVARCATQKIIGLHTVQPLQIHKFNEVYNLIIINALKIIFVLGFLIFIHEGGHFTVAKLCKVKVNEFAIGFGTTIWKKQGKETKYALRAIPLGGFVSMEGEDEISNEEGSFSKASVWKRILIVVAGATTNIIFAIILFFVIASILQHDLYNGLLATGNFISAIGESLKMLVTGHVGMDDMMGPVGLSTVVSSSKGIMDFLYIMSVISLSLGITNLLPIPALDGGKIVILLIELIRRKPMKQELEMKIQMLGFAFLITLSIFVTYNDIVRII